VIKNPLLQQAYDADWYFPWTPPAEVTESILYQAAVEEGWHEWIETPLDFQAMKKGFIYDISRDVEGSPAYWLDGHWLLSDGSVVDVEDELHYIGHVGRGDHFMRFCETFMRLTKNNACNLNQAGTPYRFLPWMRKLVATLYGWVHQDSRLRRFNTLYCALAKKSGKSAILSTIALYHLMADGVPKAQVYGAACDRNQARIIFDEAAHIVKESDVLSNLITVVDSRARLVHQQSGSFYVVLSADHHRNDGIDSSCTLVDEIHRHPNRKLVAVLQRAGLARAEPLFATITTYGPSLSDGSIWAEVHGEAKQQLAGNRPNNFRDLVFVASAEPIQVTATEDVPIGSTRIPVHRLEQPVDASEIIFDASQLIEDNELNKITVKLTEPAKRFQDYIVVEPTTQEIPRFSEAMANLDWRSDHAIKRANPSVGIITPLDRIRQDIDNARTPEREAETRQLSLNIASGSGRRLISSAAWQACSRMQVSPGSLRGRQCFGGFDLSFGNDLVGFSLAFPSWDVTSEAYEYAAKKRIDVLTWAWTPDARIEDRSELEQFPYVAYSKQPYLFPDRGPIRFCPGTTIDFGQVASDIIEICSQFECTGIAYDARFASFCVPKLEDEGLMCVVHPQGVKMSPSIKRFIETVYRGILAHGDNPILTRAVDGAQASNPNDKGESYISKSKSHTRVDPLVAAVMAVGYCCDPPQSVDGAYSAPGTGIW
jgi:phage terminase large subunit-like protein